MSEEKQKQVVFGCGNLGCGFLILAIGIVWYLPEIIKMIGGFAK